MSQHISAKNLRTLAQIVEMGKVDDLMRVAQAIIEDRPFNESSLDGKIVAVFEGFCFTEANFCETIVYKGQPLKRHRYGGGWVPADQDEHDESKPFISMDSYVSPLSLITGNSRVSGNSRVYASQVYGSQVNNSQVYDSRVSGNSQVYDSQVNNSQVYNSQVNNSQVYNSWVYNSRVYASQVCGSQVTSDVIRVVLENRR